MRHMKRYLAVFILAFCMSAMPARAWVFHDGPAFIQRTMQLVQYLQQWNQLLRTTNQQLAAYKAAYAGMKNWQNFGWIDVLRIADSPWFDGIEGIDQIREYTNASIMTAQQAMDLFDNTEELKKLVSDKRYKTDPWYAWRVNALMRQSKSAQRVKASMLRQMKQANKDLIDNVKKIKDLRDQIQVASMQSPADVATIEACQGEIQAIQAKYQGETLMMKNQQAIMFVVGEDDMMKAYENQMDRRGIKSSADICKELTKAMRKKGA